MIALTDDRLPHFHEPEPGLIAGLGYNGRGVAMSQVMGIALAARASGVPADALPFPVTTIKPIPFRRIQGAGVAPALWWMRMRDQREMARRAPRG